MIWRGRDNSGQGEGDQQSYSPPPTEPGRAPAAYDAPEQPPHAAPPQSAPNPHAAPPAPPPPPAPAAPNSQQAVGSRVETVLDAAERAAMSIREDAQVWARNYLEESKRKADEAASSRMREISDLTDSLVNRARAVAQQSDELIAAMDEAGRRVVGAATPGRNNDVGHHPGDMGEPAPPVPQAPPLQAAPPSLEPAPLPPEPAPPPPSPQPQPRSAPPPLSSPPPVAAPPAPEPPPPAAAPPPLPPLPEQPQPEPPQPPPVPERPAALPDTHEAPRPVGASSEGARLLATQMAVAGSSKDEIAWRLREEFGIEDSSGILAEIGI